MPSLHEELPYVLLEAMALCTPVIASRVGGIPEAVQDGLAALLVPPSDPASLAAAILRLHGDSATRMRLAASAKLQQATFSLEALAQQYIELHQGLRRLAR